MTSNPACDVRDTGLQAVRVDPARIAAVRATGLLDSDVEEVFDRLTRLAVRLVGVPASFISLVDADRDFYKSACGFGEPLASVRQLTGPTFCHYTVQGTEPLVIPGHRRRPRVPGRADGAHPRRRRICRRATHRRRPDGGRLLHHRHATARMDEGPGGGARRAGRLRPARDRAAGRGERRPRGSRRAGADARGAGALQPPAAAAGPRAGAPGRGAPCDVDSPGGAHRGGGGGEPGRRSTSCR